MSTPIYKLKNLWKSMVPVEQVALMLRHIDTTLERTVSIIARLALLSIVSDRSLMINASVIVMLHNEWKRRSPLDMPLAAHLDILILFQL